MNENENKADAAIRVLKRHYWANILFLAIVFLLILFRVFPFFHDGQSVGITLERYAIMISIIAIPVALKLFAETLKKEPATVNIDDAVKKYKNASYIRLYTISAVTLMNILLFAFSRNTNFFWFTVVLFIVFLFCKPSYPELMGLVEGQEAPDMSEINSKPSTNNNCSGSKDNSGRKDHTGSTDNTEQTGESKPDNHPGKTGSK